MKAPILLLTLVLSSFGLAFGQCPPPSITASQSIMCAGDSTHLCATGGYVSYLWNTGDTTQCIFAHDAGDYYVTVTGDSGCTAESNHLPIEVYPVPSVSIVEQGDTLSSFGQVVYQWYHDNNPIPGATSSVYVVTATGYYALQITDTNGCTVISSSVYVTLSPPQLSISLGRNQTVCAGSEIILNPIITGGTTGFVYSWSSTGSPLTCYNCLNPVAVITQTSVFTVTVSDNVDGPVIASVTYTVSGSLTGSLPALSFTNTNVSCTQPVDTTILSVTGGDSVYTVNWGDNTSGTNGFTPFTHDYTQPGVFIVSVTDTNGCVASAFDTVINYGLNISSQIVEPVCNNYQNGKIYLAVTGGDPPYTYSWQTGTTADSLVSLAPGTYLVTVTDAASCSAVGTFNLYPDDYDFYVFVAASVIPNCGADGSLTVVPYGGVAPYTYLWNNNDTSQSINGAEGNVVYSVNVTDAFGCTASGSSYVYPECFGLISGTAFVDSNSNCVFDSGETPIGGITIIANSNGQNFYGYTNNNGQYTIQVQGAGTFNISAYFNYNGSCGNITLCNNANQAVTLAAQGDTSLNNNIGFTGSSGFDLTLHPGWSSANPGFQKEYWVMPYNQSYTPFTGVATVVFTYDSNLIYQYSYSPLPVHDPVAHTLTWTVNSVPSPSWDWFSDRFQNFFLVPASLSLGYLLQSDFYITPTAGDCDTTNNHFHFSETVTGSHDPNQKVVSPAGAIYEEDSILTYTIYFQNTGTDSTNFIIVTDTLSPNLDPASVVNVASSHRYSKFTISGAGILTWVFNPLRLVDSLTNPSGSKAFVMFTVKKRPSRSIGTVISNQASIVFDYNTPVVTNRVTNTVAFGLGISSLPVATSADVNIFPNPSSDKIAIQPTGFTPQWITVYDVNGRMLSQQRFAPLLNVAALSAGIYFIEVKGDEATVRNKFIKL